MKEEGVGGREGRKATSNKGGETNLEIIERKKKGGGLSIRRFCIPGVVGAEIDKEREAIDRGSQPVFLIT